MSYPIEEKLVIGVSSSALFALDEADIIYRTSGVKAYREYQEQHENDLLSPGIAFPFIRRFLKLNELFPEQSPVEVVLLSRNDSSSGMRIFNSIEHYNLGICRATFTRGNSPFRYIPAYNVSLFLSANKNDVNEAIEKGFPAGLVLPSFAEDDGNNDQLRIAFDFDGVIADDSSEKIFQQNGLEAFRKNEIIHANSAVSPGPLNELFCKLGTLRTLEDFLEEQDSSYQRFLKTFIVTARCAPAHRRVINTLRQWNISVDEIHFLGGMDKGRIMEILKPHIFFDDQITPNLESGSKFAPAVHIPFGIMAER